MDTDAKGQLGGLESSKEVRERMAAEGGTWRCPTCARSNREILKEREAMVKEMEEKEGKRTEDVVPEELRLAYRDELGQEKKQNASSGETMPVGVSGPADMAGTTPTTNATTSVSASRSVPAPRPTRTVPTPAPAIQHIARPSPDRSLAWIDTCIYGIGAMLVFLLLKKIAA